MDAIQWISTYETLFNISLAVTVLGFGLAVFFFFYFDIRNLHAIMTGKAKAETIRRMEERNARTGSLRLTGDEKASRHASASARITPPQNVVTERITAQNDAVRKQDMERPETAVLSMQAPDTTVLVNDYEATEATTLLDRTISDMNFHVTESTMVIHTDEII